jgi:L-glyceraldehyde reductase
MPERNQNDVKIAEGIAKSGVPREDITIVSKLWNNSHRPELCEADLDTTLSQLRTSYVDIWLIHWPVPFKPGKDLEPLEEDGKRRAIDHEAPGIAVTWQEVVRLWKETSKIKAVGVSNFNVEQLERIIQATGVVPVMNQIECHPNLIQPELFDYCTQKGIVITAFSPLGNNITGMTRVIDTPEIVEIAKRLNRDPAQVLIAWVAKQGFCVIPKSVTPKRIAVSAVYIKNCLSADLKEQLRRLRAD